MLDGPSSSNLIDSCVISENSYAGIWMESNARENNIANCEINENNYGIELQLGVQNNTFQNNKICENTFSFSCKSGFDYLPQIDLGNIYSSEINCDEELAWLESSVSDC
jgi:parallel beta-helix repeat protein